MKNFTKIAVCAMMFAGFFIVSAETINLADKSYLRKQFGEHSATGTEFTTRGRTFLAASRPVGIDPAKKYSFKLKVTGKTEKNVRLYIGFNLMDINGRPYQALAWQGIASTFTVVTRAAKAGDSVIYVKNGQTWLTSAPVYIALDAKEDNSDIPNTKIVRSNVKSKVRKGDEWEIVLKTPLKADIAEGTNVRQHIAGGYFYTAVKTIKPTDGEIVLSGSVQGYAKNIGYFNGKNWPVGVKKARFLVLADWNNAGATLNFKDAVFTIE